ncbi:MAG: cation transporter [Clostridia bacterium]|nr:cation transporter [Clostridia bacterium]
MKKVFKVENVDCAHCAMKMQQGIEKINGVESAVLNFMTQRLTIEFDETKQERILEEAEKACKKIDRDVKIIR